MRCPYCGASDTKVIDSRPSDDDLKIRRRRECIVCAKRFTTYEAVETTPLILVKKNGERENDRVFIARKNCRREWGEQCKIPLSKKGLIRRA